MRKISERFECFIDFYQGKSASWYCYSHIEYYIDKNFHIYRFLPDQDYIHSVALLAKINV